MKTFILFQSALTAVLAVAIPAEPENDRLTRRAIFQKRGWSLTFADDFTGTTFMGADLNWVVDTGTQYPSGPTQWGNSESESYTTTTSNLALSPSGTLLITPQLTKGKWTSGRIETAQSNFNCTAGKQMYIESRLRVGNASTLYQQGIWPAFWSLGTAFRTHGATGWPFIGEWDIFESINGLPTAYNTIHCGTAPGGYCNEYNGIKSGGSTFSRGVFHEVGFMVDRTSGDWKTETLAWYLDGVQTFNVTGARIGDQATWAALAHTAHYLLLNVAVGGSFPNALAGGLTPTSRTVGGTSVGMEVDYVVVWNSA